MYRNKPTECILGAIAGDIIGSAYEFDNVKSLDFVLFTEETYFTGDSDTIACITGGIAEAFYQTIPQHITTMVSVILGPDILLDTVMPFSKKYRVSA